MAATIMVLHAVVPHQHADEMDVLDPVQTKIEAKSWLDYLQVFFLTDLGEGHMETFDQEKGLDLEIQPAHAASPSLLAFLNTLPTIYPREISFIEVVQRHDVPIRRQFPLSNIDFRGPPMCV